MTQNFITKFSRKTQLKIQFTLLTFVLFGLGCAQKHSSEEVYQAINKTDTAVLHLNRMGDRFFGKYEIFHSSLEKDSGTVNGKILGDTLNGTFLYVPYYNSEELKRKPIAFLEKNGKLLIGKGSVSVYMGIPFFSTEIPIDYKSPEFIFEKVVHD